MTDPLDGRVDIAEFEMRKYKREDSANLSGDGKGTMKTDITVGDSIEWGSNEWRLVYGYNI
jgi:hypothetical protein